MIRTLLLHFVVLKCSNTGNVLTDHIHAQFRGIECKESETYTLPFTRKVHKAFANSTIENCAKAVPICTSLIHNTYELCSSCCADSSCVCMSQADLTAANNHTVLSFAACGAVRIGRIM